jgi:hypothetical protein
MSPFQSLVLTRPCLHAARAAATESLRLKGNAAFKAGQLLEALLHYKAAVALDPCNPLLYNNISLVQLKMGKVTEVRSCVQGRQQCRAHKVCASGAPLDTCAPLQVRCILACSTNVMCSHSDGGDVCAGLLQHHSVSARAFCAGG